MTFTRTMPLKMAQYFPHYTLITCLALCNSLNKVVFTDRDTDKVIVKWPNDLIFRKKKLSGVLADSE